MRSQRQSIAPFKKRAIQWLRSAYRVNRSVKVKVLDFVKRGGPRRRVIQLLDIS